MIASELIRRKPSAYPCTSSECNLITWRLGPFPRFCARVSSTAEVQFFKVHRERIAHVQRTGQRPSNYVEGKLQSRQSACPGQTYRKCARTWFVAAAATTCSGSTGGVYGTMAPENDERVKCAAQTPHAHAQAQESKDGWFDQPYSIRWASVAGSTVGETTVFEGSSRSVRTWVWDEFSTRAVICFLLRLLAGKRW